MGSSFDPYQYGAMVSLISCTVTWPCAVYFGHQLHLNWDATYIRGRKRGIILLGTIVIYYWLFFHQPASLLEAYLEANDYPFFNALYIVNANILPLSVALVTLRIYSLYFDYQYSHFVLVTRWQILVDPAAGRDNWFLQNKQCKFGCDQYLMTRVLCPTMLIYAAAYFSVRFSLEAVFSDDAEFIIFVRRSVDLSFEAFSLLLGTVICTIFWRRYPSFNDNLLIRQEMTYFLKFLFVPICIIFTAVAAFSANGLGQVSIFAMPLLQFILVAWLWLTIKYPQRIRTTNALKAGFATSMASWATIVSTQEGYESFACFLEKEFSIENILFVTEV